MIGSSVEQLPCGRPWDDLLEQVALGVAVPDPHQQVCSHCQAALAELDRVWAPVRDLAAEPVHVPAGLLDRVMQQVRAAAQQNWHALIGGEGGSTRVAARVIATMARLAAGRVPGVHVALGRTTDPGAAADTAARTSRHDQKGSAVGVAGGSAVVELALAARYDVPLHALAEHVQSAVTADLTRLAGLQHVQVNITIDDVTR